MLESQEYLLEKKSIRDLPNEILLSIFSYLQTYDIKYSISKVCVQWSTLARDKKLWRHLFFKTTNKQTKTFGAGSWYSTLMFLQNTPELQNLIISQGHSDEEVAEIVKALNDNCPNVRHLECEIDVSLVFKHLKGSHTFSNLESIKLTLGCSHSQSIVFKNLSGCKNLKKITFLGSNPELNGFRNVLKDCVCLEDVDVSRVEFSKSNFMSLVKFKEKFKVLGLKTDKLDDNCLKLLMTFPELKNLTLSDGNTSPEKLSYIGKLKCVNSLHLEEPASSPVLTAATLTDFFRDGCFTSLTELKLHKSRLDDEGAAEIRRNCVNLLYLEVMTYPRSRSSLSEKALVHFLHCKRLHHFEILFDNSQESDWTYRRIRYVHHDCDVDEPCSFSLEELLDCWDEMQIPID